MHLLMGDRTDLLDEMETVLPTRFRHSFAEKIFALRTLGRNAEDHTVRGTDECDRWQGMPSNRSLAPGERNSMERSQEGNFDKATMVMAVEGAEEKILREESEHRPAAAANPNPKKSSGNNGRRGALDLLGQPLAKRNRVSVGSARSITIERIEPGLVGGKMGEEGGEG